MISREVLYAKFTYDDTDGTLRHKKKKGVQEGDIVGSLDRDGYLATLINFNGQRKGYRVHRLIWFFVHGEMPSGVIDHINHNRIDNRIENLRDVSPIDNSRNRLGHNRKIMGVNKIGNKWSVTIGVKNKNTYLGLYETYKEAVLVRMEAEKENGYHANHGRMIND